MSLRLYNTLTRRIETFQPLAPPRVTMYTCGPTVWNYAHIGNFRSFLFEDLLRRHLEASGYSVFHIMNLTDVDDRTIKAAAEGGKSLSEHTEPFVRAFFEDRDFLRIRPAHVYPRATTSIAAMVELITTLLEKGYAYIGEDGSVYFSIAKFPAYGRLSQLDKRELKVGARVSSDEYDKDDPRDFALWKAASPLDEQVGAAWDAPFGRGRPGWHIECSAMALSEIARFGVKTLDIHCGGVDNIFPHHEDEIAQSEAATGEPFARFWLHGEFLNIRGTKMSKRYGNILTVRDLKEEGVDPAAFRLLVFSTHYRQPLDYNDQALEAASEGVRRLGEFHERLSEVAGEAAGKEGPATGVVAARVPEAVGEFRRQFKEALDDDLNAPQAVAALFGLVREGNRELDRGAWGPEDAWVALAAFREAMDVLDLLPGEPEIDQEFRAWVEAKVAERQAARRVRDYGRADAIRDELRARGVELEDTPDGTRWRVQRGAGTRGAVQ
ncbi:MAG: cysteine--tRNA ligase [Gemmatimonadales bacterium]|nr:MAG: cysteine--tRNA ligase [Gemmatimonadales bacterium]